MKAKTVLSTILTVLVIIVISGCEKWEPIPAINGRGAMVQEYRQTGNFKGLQVDVDARVNITQSSIFLDQAIVIHMQPTP